jgi:hypothetical protein
VALRRCSGEGDGDPTGLRVVLWLQAALGPLHDGREAVREVIHGERLWPRHENNVTYRGDVGRRG